ncbi:hypothetical protein E1211_01715 [Micromonospora sp. 15K316]|uniref:hypothetical protein n=1 Tax=Micromonospora sp. 15K316 TaxID=2530376 RepID=UPI0010485443|nr:hypothetical protein [Micromonospora sp. 15K316]TDC40229.1 hypothetical protein E1211_01715 [Micromonospora sp. 15K316]
MSVGLAKFLNVFGVIVAAVCFAPVFRPIIAERVLRKSDPKDRVSVERAVKILFWTGLGLLLASLSWQAVKVMQLLIWSMSVGE